MRRDRIPVRSTLVLVVAALVGVLAATAGPASAKQLGGTVTGTGSTFVAPLVNAWDGGGGSGPVQGQLGISLNYTGTGSGAGVGAITNKQVDFGASDAPLTQFQGQCAPQPKGSCIEIPWALAGTAVIYHVPGTGSFLKLPPAVIAGIYLGNVKFWDAAPIRAANAGVTLPHLAITVVHRSDISGTSYNFSDYLSHVSPTWRSSVGATTDASSWPVGEGEHGSSGVAGTVKATKGAIGYVDVAYAITNHIQYAAVRNAAGEYVRPSLNSIRLAGNYDKAPAANGSLSIVDPPASVGGAYPICTYTYAIVQKHSGSEAAALRTFLDWAISSSPHKGQTYGPPLLFYPIPASVQSYDTTEIAKITS